MLTTVPKPHPKPLRQPCKPLSNTPALPPMLSHHRHCQYGPYQCCQYCRQPRRIWFSSTGPLPQLLANNGIHFQLNPLHPTLLPSPSFHALSPAVSLPRRHQRRRQIWLRPPQKRLLGQHLDHRQLLWPQGTLLQAQTRYRDPIQLRKPNREMLNSCVHRNSSSLQQTTPARPTTPKRPLKKVNHQC